MANIITLSFNNQIDLRAEKYIYQTNGDHDCLDALSTSFKTVTYSYNGSEFAAFSSGNSSPVDRDNTGTYTVGQYDFHLVNYKIIPYAAVIEVRRTGGAGALGDISAKIRFGPDTSIGNITDDNQALFPTVNTSDNTSGYSIAYLANKDMRAYQYIQIQRDGTRSNSDGDFVLYNIWIYGTIQPLDPTDSIPALPAATTIGDLKDSFINDQLLTKGTLLYTNALTVEPTAVFKTYTETLSANFNLDEISEYTIYILDPGGVDRDVILPFAVYPGLYLKIINSNGANKLIVKEDTTTIATLSTADITLISECIYDGTQWIVTNG